MQECEAAVRELRRRLEEQEELNPEQKLQLLNQGLNQALSVAGLQADSRVLVGLRSSLYLSGVLSHCVRVLSSRLKGGWSSAATLAQLTSSCCVGVEPGERSEEFHRLFLPSVMDGLLSLASQLVRRDESVCVLRTVLDAVCWLLRAQSQLTAQVLSSTHYEQIQMCDDETVSLLCVQMWTQACSSSDFLSGLTDDSLLLLLNEAVGQLAVSSDSAVGGASVRLILLSANQHQARVQRLLRHFRGLDSLLDKDWRGRGFNQELDQLIKLIQSDRGNETHYQASPERVQAACVLQAAWRSYQTRRRVKSLSRAVSTLQRRYRARRRQQQQQREAEQWEDELRYQVCVRRQQARRLFHQKQRKLLQLLPPAQVQSYLQECERRAAVVIQSFWRGFRERRRYNAITHTHTVRSTHTQQQAARTLQRAVRHFLQRRRAAEAPPTPGFWIGQSGLTDSRRVELQRQVDEVISLHPSSRVSRPECERLLEEVQQLLQEELLRGAERRREEQRVEALLAHTHTQLELLRDAPPLSVATVTDSSSLLSPAGPVSARARLSHNALLLAPRRPWWRMLEEEGGGAWPDPAHTQQLEAELGGLFVGGQRNTCRPRTESN